MIFLFSYIICIRKSFQFCQTKISSILLLLFTKDLKMFVLSVGVFWIFVHRTVQNVNGRFKYEYFISRMEGVVTINQVCSVINTETSFNSKFDHLFFNWFMSREDAIFFKRKCNIFETRIFLREFEMCKYLLVVKGGN